MLVKGHEHWSCCHSRHDNTMCSSSCGDDLLRCRSAVNGTQQSTCMCAQLSCVYTAELQDAEALLAKIVAECGCSAELLQGRDAQLAAYAVAYTDHTQDSTRLMRQLRQSLLQVGSSCLTPSN